MITQADKAQAIERPATYDELSNLIDSSDEWTAGALMKLYQYQTTHEQQSGSTVEDNGIGFNAIDAPILSDMARFYLNRRYLTPRQIIFVRKTIKKYINQLLSIGSVYPIGLQSCVQAAPKPAEMTASLLTNKETGKLTGIMVKFNFPKGDNRFGEVLADVKTLPDRRWIAESKYWKVGLSLEAGNKLKEWGFTFSEGLEKWYDGIKPKDIGVKSLPLDERLFLYQKEGVAFIESRKGTALIGDEQGLGKTCQSLSWLNLHPKVRPVVVICGASLKLNWEKEIKMWVKKNNSIHIISGQKPYPLSKADFYIINYDIMGDAKRKKISADKLPEFEKEGWIFDGKSTNGSIWVVKPKGWVAELAKMNLAMAVTDEIQKIKSDKAQRTRACLYLSKFTKCRQGLSGTPLKNKAVEIFNPIKFIDPQIFPSFWRFTDDFTHKIQNRFGWEFNGVKNAARLHEILTSTCMIRRKKIDVLKDLPPKMRCVVPLEITNKAEYDRIMGEFDLWLNQTYTTKSGQIKFNYENPAATMVKIEKLKQATIAGKMDMAVQWIEDFLESDKKLIIFATHTETLNILERKFGDICVRLDGGTNQKKRQEAVDRFQGRIEVGRKRIPIAGGGYSVEIEYEDIPDEKQPKLFLGNIIAASEGITLTAASDVAFLEYSFVPADHMQAEDRPHRIGQTNQVMIWYLAAAGTIEEKLVEILQKKAKIMDQVLDGKKESDESVFDELIREIKG